ncbi:transglutaminase family protein [Maritimibacter sp. UBA3975]|uniref:transglutaminase family protein n=1 Tax=Maritimibacter sp. UBA3975 TaxID=1946833 RepID=UPI000C09D4C4|nr:transglutaminase family protein [Maritimibacter sp. UBA3975]MAM63594.1 transglutaminase [Maritimibacter sp.]|tara:strand:+ start:11660 stop:12457 length:798 start_codon:yes stop_codon:yes gene_type:complete
MRLRIKHVTRYRFDEPVVYGLQQLRKFPKSGHQQQVVSWSTTVENGQKEVTFEDNHNNTVELISFDRDATEVVVTSEGEVMIEDNGGVVGAHPGPSPLWLYERETPLTKCGPGCRALIRKIEGEADLERLHSLLAVVGDEVAYLVDGNHPEQTAEEAVAEGKGVCQDHTHIFLACAREMGFAARYVSGYLMMDDRVEQDATHAWAEVHVDALGWVGFDVSNKQSPDARYVRVATGLDYTEAAPVIGSRVGGSAETLDVQIQVAQQ